MLRQVLKLGIPFDTVVKIQKINFLVLEMLLDPLLVPLWGPFWTPFGLHVGPFGDSWGLQLDPFGHFWGRDGNLGDDGKRNGVYGMEMDVLGCFLERRWEGVWGREGEILGRAGG